MEEEEEEEEEKEKNPLRSRSSVKINFVCLSHSLHLLRFIKAVVKKRMGWPEEWGWGRWGQGGRSGAGHSSTVQPGHALPGAGHLTRGVLGRGEGGGGTHGADGGRGVLLWPHKSARREGGKT